MSADLEIDELLRQDEAELKAKRKRLKSFATAIDDMRRAQQAAAQLATDLVSSGDMTRNDLGKVFKLSRAEKSVLLPARRSSNSETKPETANADTDNSNSPESSHENPESDAS